MISTIIVNYNAGDVLLTCITSVLPQCSEVIVVDNASTDDSLAIIERVYGNDARVRVSRHSENVGFARACNKGAELAQHPYLFFLNPDCICQPNALLELKQTLDTDNTIGMVGGLLLNPDGTEQAGGRRLTPTPSRTLVRVLGLSRFAKRWPHLLVDFNLHHHPLPSVPIPVEAISGACMLVKPSIRDQVGLWDDGYFLHCEDLDWCMRIRQAGFLILFVPAAQFVHAQGTCSKSRPLFVEWHKHKGMTRFYRKFFSDQYPLPLLWLVIATIWARFGLLALRQRAKELLKVTWPIKSHK